MTALNMNTQLSLGKHTPIRELQLLDTFSSDQEAIEISLRV
jgi:hypothetical protein